MGKGIGTGKDVTARARTLQVQELGNGVLGFGLGATALASLKQGREGKQTQEGRKGQCTGASGSEVLSAKWGILCKGRGRRVQGQGGLGPPLGGRALEPPPPPPVASLEQGQREEGTTTQGLGKGQGTRTEVGRQVQGQGGKTQQGRKRNGQGTGKCKDTVIKAHPRFFKGVIKAHQSSL